MLRLLQCGSTMRQVFVRLVVFTLLVASWAQRGGGQTRRDVVQGRVTADSGLPVAGAEVIVTVSPTASVFRESSDSSGRFRITIDGGTGEYVFFAGALGRRSFRVRLLATGADTIFNVAVVLQAMVTTIAPVSVQARVSRPMPSLGDGDAPRGVTTLDKTMDGVAGALPPDLATSLDAMASTMPGLSIGPDGFSVVGLPSSGNAIRLNGLSFSGGDLPRDVRTTARFSSSPWDPTVGGFSGVLAARNISAGSNLVTHLAHITVDEPWLQLSDRVASGSGATFGRISASEAGAGPIEMDRLFYNYGLQVSRATSNVVSAELADDAILRAAGLSSDSVRRAIALLSQLGAPSITTRGNHFRETLSLTAVDQLDFAPPRSGGLPVPSWRLTGVGSYSRSTGLSLGADRLSSTAGSGSRFDAALQGSYTRYFGSQRTLLSESSASVSVSASESSPDINAPAGRVAISSRFGDGSAALGNLAFGGGPPTRGVDSWTFEANTQLSVLLGQRQSLPVKVFLESRLEASRSYGGDNTHGLFTYPSLQSLAANTPSSFTQTLRVPTTSGGQWLGAGAVSGSWTTGSLKVVGGVRLDANAFLLPTSAQDTVTRVLGIVSSGIPNSFAVSPRIGFTLRLPGSQGLSSSGTALSRLDRGPTVLRGGIGKFRATLGSRLVAGTRAGIGSSVQRVSCSGSDLPQPDWIGLGLSRTSVVSECSSATALVDSAPPMTLVSDSFAPNESWRASVGITRTIFGAYLALDGVYAINSHLTSTVDLNFSGIPKFDLTQEGGRPVFVPPSSFDPMSGLSSPAGSRRSTAFGSVRQLVSDLGGDARQLTIYAIPLIPTRFGVLTIAYTWADARIESRGFDQITTADPRARVVSPSANTPRHTFLAQFAKVVGSTWGISAFARVASGLPFTPSVVGDVNGDGLQNDAAFVFDPAATSDSAVAGGMRRLLEHGPSWVRDCLSRQIGRVARQNSCTGPWSTSMNASIFIFPSIPWTHNRSRLTLTLSNVPGGLDYLIHGSSGLRGWGSSTTPEASLLRIQSFDNSTKQFGYAVNPRFGSSDPGATLARSPFRVSLDFALDLGRSADEQRLDLNLRVRPALANSKASADSLKVRYMYGQGSNGYSDFYGYLLTQLADSLALSFDQIRVLQAEREALTTRVDALYGELARYLAHLPRDFDRGEALAKVRETNEASWRLIYRERAFLSSTLTAGQVRLLPSVLVELISDPEYRGRFFFGF